MTMPDVIYNGQIRTEINGRVTYICDKEKISPSYEPYHHDRILKAKEREIEVLREALNSAKFSYLGGEYVCVLDPEAVAQALAEADKLTKGEK